jgi:hypothetical protein
MGRLRRAVGLAGVLALGMAACVHNAPAVTPPSVFDTLDRELSRREAVQWSASRPLTWDDFQGVPPAGDPERAAETAYTLLHAVNCRGRVFTFRVVAAFLPRQSWVRPSVRTNAAQSARSLSHEQTHFNLSEVYARRIRRYFAELQDPCLKSEREIEAQADQLIREEAAAQRRYDDETSHGRIGSKQNSWDADTVKQIADLQRYSK